MESTCDKLFSKTRHLPRGLPTPFMVVAGLILLGIVVAGLTWRWEIRTGRTKKAARQRAAEQPVVDGV